MNYSSSNIEYNTQVFVSPERYEQLGRGRPYIEIPDRARIMPFAMEMENGPVSDCTFQNIRVVY